MEKLPALPQFHSRFTFSNIKKKNCAHKSVLSCHFLLYSANLLSFDMISATRNFTKYALLYICLSKHTPIYLLTYQHFWLRAKTRENAFYSHNISVIASKMCIYVHKYVCRLALLHDKRTFLER